MAVILKEVSHSLMALNPGACNSLMLTDSSVPSE